MKLLIHDLREDEIQKLVSNSKEDILVISNHAPIRHCIGCFGCWVKTPGACVIRDEYGNMGELLSRCDEMHIISECYYGGLSSFTKNIFDRSISYMHPYFELRKGEMHHKSRYQKKIHLNVWFYGKDITPEEKETARKLVAANALNINAQQNTVSFYKNFSDMEGSVL